MVRTRRIADTMISAGGLGVLTLGMVTVNSDFREQVGNLLAGRATGEMAMVADRIDKMARFVIDMAGDYGAANTPLLAFGLVAVVLFLFMMRT